MKTTKKWTSGLAKGMVASVLAPVLMSSATPVFAAENAPEIDANAAMAVDFESGKVLLTKMGMSSWVLLP